MNAARTFRDLRAYQLARAASLEIFEASRSFPGEEKAGDDIKAVFIGKIDEAPGEGFTETRF
jgi:hypothetical protein